MATEDPTLLDALPVGVLVHRGGVISRVNPVAAEVIGGPPERIVGRPVTAFLSPEEGARLLDRYQRRLRGERVPAEYECTVLRLDGRHRRVEVSVSLRGGDAIIVMRDVAERSVERERRLALAHLGASLHMHRTEDAVLQAFRAGIAEVGLAPTLLDVGGESPVALFVDLPGVLRLPFAELAGGELPGWRGGWSPGLEEAARWGEAFVDDVASEVDVFWGPRFGELVRARADELGPQRVVLTRLDRMQGPAQVIAIVGPWLREDDVPMVRLLVAQIATALDNARALTEARRKEREVEAVGRLAKSLLAVAPESPARVAAVARAQMADALGARSAEVLLLDPEGSTLVGPDDAAEVDLDATPLARDVIARTAPAAIADTATDPRAWRADREERSQSVLLVPLASPRGSRGIVTISDLPGRRFHDEEVALALAMGSVVDVALENAGLYAESRQRLTQLSDTQAQLVQQERLAALGELAAVMAHEVRNPLGIIFNALGALGRAVGPGEGEAQVCLQILREEADRLNRIVGDLLDFARPIAPAMRREDVGALLEEAVHAALVAEGAQGAVDVTLALPDELPTVPLDARLFRQALVNLCANAVQAMSGAGRLTLSATVEGVGVAAALRIDVADEGAGIPESVRARIFEPFFTTKATGTGLGLAVVRRIVEAHGGELWVECPDAGGTVVSVRVPLAERGAARVDFDEG